MACLLGANAVLLLPARDYGHTGSNTIYTLSWVALAGVAVLFSLSTISWRPSTLIMSLCIGSFALLSATWSVAPTSTLQYGSAFLANLLVAHLIALDVSLSEAAQMIGRTILYLSLAGILLYMIGIPQVLYFDTHDRPNLLGGEPFRGLFVHKITAGLYASIGVAWAVCGLIGVKRLLAIAVFASTVVLSGSTTGIVIFAASLSISTMTVWAVKGRMTGGSYFFSIGILGLAAAAFILTSWRELLGALGRDVTLTGRTHLWAIGIETWAERPVLGWGFSAYFNSPYGYSPRQQIAAFENYDVPHFHQSLIQTGVDMGVLGVVLALGLIIYNLAKSYRIAILEGRTVSTALFPMMATLTIASVAMFNFLTYNHFGTFMLFLLAYLLSSRPARREAVHVGVVNLTKVTRLHEPDLGRKKVKPYSY